MSDVISEEQRKLNKALHENRKDFGSRDDGSGLAGNLPTALKRMNDFGACNSVLDYGTGKGKLVERLKRELPDSINIMGYDPAVEEWKEKPNEPVDILVSLDVLEHIEMQSIDAVLKDIARLTKNFCYLVIDLQPAIKKLADGRNAHILLAPPEWWVTRVSQLFPCIATFPIMHTRGVPQKLIIAGTQHRKMIPLMYGFLIKMKLFEFEMAGGPLGGLKGRGAKK